MRIAFLVGRFPSLSETFILNQITGLLDRGHDVDIYARRPDDGDKVHPDVLKYRLLDRVSYRAMPSNALLRTAKALALAARHPAAAGGSLNFFRHGKEAASLKLLYWSAAFRRRAQRPYDILHAHFGPNGLLALALRQISAVNPSAKLLTTFYGYDVHRYPRNHGPRVYQPLFGQADAILTLSQTMSRDLAALGCSESKLTVHHIGTDTAKFAFSARQSPTDGVCRLVSVARLVEKKGLDFAVKAVAEAAATGLKLHYDIVGDGDGRASLESLIRSLGLGDTVHLLGWKTQTEVADILGRAHVLLAPSVTAASGDQEGTPVALMEAMAMGLPVISTHHSGIPEMIRDGDNGYLVPERDPTALADRIIHLARHPEEWDRLGRAGRGVVEREFDTNRLNDRLVEIYQQCIQGPMG
jgi:colanic acid/amylovoran biosynthesis glycosyltransferase